MTLHDTGGVAAIGGGAEVALSEFTVASYVPNWDRARTLRLVYTAKRKAEDIESVGRQTDLFEITADGRANREDLLAGLEQIYGTAQSQCSGARRGGVARGGSWGWS